VPGSIRIEIEYPHPPDRVWAALTDQRAIAEWLMPNDFEPRLGRAFQFRAPNARGWSGIVDCTVVELDPPRRLAYTWKSGQVETVVTWSLQPTPRGTRLELVHSGFRGVGQTILRKLMMGPGWNRMLERTFPRVVERMAEGSASTSARGGSHA
jgi:uncharacterized protein YndB with AHSA1/START domain